MRRNNIEIRKPTERDVKRLVENLREADKVELKAYLNDNFEWIIKASIKASDDAWAVIVNGKLLFIAGVGQTSMIGKVGCPWLLGTDHIAQFPLEFYRQSKGILFESLRVYKTLLNHVHVGNLKAISYLKHLGFKFSDAVPYGANGELFYPFQMEIKS